LLRFDLLKTVRASERTFSRATDKHAGGFIFFTALWLDFWEWVKMVEELRDELHPKEDKGRKEKTEPKSL